MLNEKQLKVINATEPKIIVQAASAAGKAQPNDTTIPTPNGYKKIGELREGDYVFDRYGKPEKILGVYPQGKLQVYRVTLADGRTTECSGEHLWSYNNSHGGFTTKTLEEMYNKGLKKNNKKGHNEYKYRIPNLKNPVEYPHKNLDINPYTMGCFLGDGCCLEKGLTLSSNDPFIVQEIARLEDLSYKKNSERNYSWTFYHNGKRVQTQKFFEKYEKEICQYCGKKRIPEDYLLGDTQQRLDLLQGLMDTDGYPADGKNSPEYSTTSYGLALDVAELARSLGFKTKIYTSDRKDKKSIEYSVGIFTTAALSYTIFRLPRKKNKAFSFKDKKTRYKYEWISITNIEKLDVEKEMTCIYVDHPEHLYLTNSFIVTHNTATLTAQVKKLINDNNDPSKIVVITFTNAAADEMKDRIGRVEGLFIGTIHSYACFLLNRCGVSVKEYIENEDFDKFFLLVEKHPECIREVEYLLLDEAQDTGKLQLQFILEMIKPKHWTFYGDIRQSIYSWNGARPDLYKALMRDPEVKVYTLNQNYRNGVDILSFAKTLIDRLGFDFFDDSEPMRDEYGEVIICNYSKERILDEIMERPQYGDWFILTRSNAQLEMIKTYLEKNDIPCSTFKRSQLTKEEFSKEMKANTVKVLTIHTSKGLENKNVIVIGAKLYQDEEVRLAYVAATRARDYLVWMMPERKKNNKTKIKSWE